MKRSVRMTDVKLVTIMLCLFAGVCFGTLRVNAATKSGTRGDNISWTLTDDGTLTIEGKGEMCPYDDLKDEHGGVSSDKHYGYYSDSVKKIIIKEGITSIQTDEFSGYSNLVSVNLPSTMKEIGGAAFFNCRKLEKINIPNGLVKIKSNAFSQCYKLEKISLPDSVTEIGIDAFSDSGLKSVKIPKKITKIEEGTFGHCSKLKSVVIPSSVTSIGDKAFVNCYELTTISKLTNVKTIGKHAFTLDKLSKIVFSDKLQSIGEYAFNGCDLKSITIPKNVKKIGKSAFSSCSKVKTITIKTTKLNSKNFGKNVFAGAGFENQTVTVRFPKKKYSAYKKLCKQKKAVQNCPKIKYTKI